MSYAGHAKAIALLGLPLIGGNLAQFAIGMTDSVMLGWYGVEALAAVTLANSYYFVIYLTGAGFGWAVMPMVAAANGEGDDVSARRSARMGLWLSWLFAAAAMPALWWAEPILRAMGQQAEVSADAAHYLRISGWGLFPALLLVVLKSYLAAMERTQIVLWITVLAALTNAAANYVFIFGHFGASELGVRGAALASVITQIIALVAVVAYVLRALPEHELFRRFWRPDWEMFARVFRLGVPIGLTSLSEVTLFTASSLMMGWLGIVPLAAHGIALQLASATFMVHMGLSNAATVRVGNAYGRGDRAHMMRGALVVTVMSLGLALLASAAFLIWPEALISLFLDPADPERAQILSIGVGLLAAAALFQLVDGGQVVALGLLHGVQDMTMPMVIAALSYWVVGLPCSYLLGFTFGFGGIGIWLGLVLGLACAAVLLMARFWRLGLGQGGSAQT
ncbi:MAG: MATE family efflux transporter [Pseudodonghicola sp.]